MLELIRKKTFSTKREKLKYHISKIIFSYAQLRELESQKLIYIFLHIFVICLLFLNNLAFVFFLLSEPKMESNKTLLIYSITRRTLQILSFRLNGLNASKKRARRLDKNLRFIGTIMAYGFLLGLSFGFMRWF